MQTEKLLYMQIEKTELEKAKYRDICRDTHLMQCNGKTCSSPLGHSPYEGRDAIERAKSLGFPLTQMHLSPTHYVNNIDKEDVKNIDKYKCGGTTNYGHEQGYICDRCNPESFQKITDKKFEKEKCSHPAGYVCVQCNPEWHAGMNKT